MTAKRPDDTTVSAETSRARFERIKGEVQLLTPKQRRDLITLLGGEDAAASAETSDAAPSIGVFYAAIVEVLRDSVAIDSAPPLAVAMRSLGSDIKRASSAFDAFALKHFRVELNAGRLSTRTLRVMQHRLLAGVVLSYMRSNSTPVSLRSLVQQCGNVALIFDSMFPGYCAAGLAHLVMSRSRTV